jgi:LPS export ABC transporter protein LptC
LKIQPIIKNLLGVTCLLFVVACQSAQSPSNSAKSETKTENRSETKLILNDAILEQSNETGTISWKIQAKSTVYTEDKQTAYLESVTGNLIENGRIVLQISGDRARVSDNGNFILLEGNVIASDPRNGAVVKSNSIEWRPKENLFIVPNNLTGNHKNLQIKATTGKYFTDRESLELSEGAVVTTFQPSLQLKSDRLTWHIPQKSITSTTPINIVRYDRHIVTDRLTAEAANLDLGKSLATLTKNIELISLNPQLQIATDSLLWNYQTRLIETDKPIQIVDRINRLTITGNRGTLDLAAEIAKLQNGIEGINTRDSAYLYARELIWQIKPQTLEANDDVIYRQNNPQLELTGDKAIGNLQNNHIVVSSYTGQKQRVISTINDKSQ